MKLYDSEKNFLGHKDRKGFKPHSGMKDYSGPAYDDKGNKILVIGGLGAGASLGLGAFAALGGALVITALLLIVFYPLYAPLCLILIWDHAKKKSKSWKDFSIFLKTATVVGVVSLLYYGSWAFDSFLYWREIDQICKTVNETMTFINEEGFEVNVERESRRYAAISAQINIYNRSNSNLVGNELASVWHILNRFGDIAVITAKCDERNGVSFILVARA